MNPAFVLKKVSSAHRHLKGISSNIPNQNISIHTLSLQEAKDSSAVENIATHDELFKEKIFPNETRTKEVGNYASALRKGFQLVKDSKLLTGKHILAVQEELEKNKAGYRRLSGTDLKNQQTGEVIYTPPQSLK
ncbi:Fic/DOC family N-terminal domain-containing protein [Leptospira interrogans]|uniref:Fic/DOC family N-terminal domain-containing protein n=1 Tax=Leptospira interrogans TaxID=173 RepID=UPI0009E58D55|nr:Fic/DOC family N-terminal domain-containing protein [Leptospira interrogans]